MSTFTDVFRIVSIDLLSVVPPVLGSLEEVRLAIFVCECRIDVTG